MTKNWRAVRIEELWEAYQQLTEATTNLTAIEASIDHELFHCGTTLREEIKRRKKHPSMTTAERAESRRAQARAMKIIKPGDTVIVRQCAGMTSTYRFASWDGLHGGALSVTNKWFSAGSILAVNGKSVSFFFWAQSKKEETGP